MHEYLPQPMALVVETDDTQSKVAYCHATDIRSLTPLHFLFAGALGAAQKTVVSGEGELLLYSRWTRQDAA
jgi:hypothetical protein